MAYAQSIEAIALLVLTGHYIGHLPSYYVDDWIVGGRMRVIQPGHLSYQNRFGYTIRDAVKPARLVKALSGMLMNIKSTIE